MGVWLGNLPLLENPNPVSTLFIRIVGYLQIIELKATCEFGFRRSS